MSNKERTKSIIESMPDYKIDRIIWFLEGMKADDDIEDDMYCERLLDEYLDDPDPDKHEAMSLEDFAKSEGITFCAIDAGNRGDIYKRY
mgnify:CR=1 FL=1